MKTNLLKTIALAVVMTLFCNCSTELIPQATPDVELTQSSIEQLIDDGPCNDQDPKSRLINNSNSVVNLEIEDSNGALLSYEYGLDPGLTSDWISFPVGSTTFKISSPTTYKNIVIVMGLCMAYEVTIDEDHQLNTDVPIQL